MVAVVAKLLRELLIELLNKIELDKPNALVIVYDGECPFCNNFAEFYRLKSKVKSIALINAREHPGLVSDFANKGQSLDDGMVVFWRGQTHYGPKAMQCLAMLNESGGFFGAINRFLFVRSFAGISMASVFYPVLVRLRKITLFFLRKTPL